MSARRPASGELTVWLSYCALAAYFTWPLLASGANVGVEDWDAILFHHAAVLKTVYEYGQMPFWNPWYCGGDALWQNPQVPLVTPTYLFALAMPLARAIKATVFVHYLIGFAGMHLLQRRVLGVTFLPAVLFFAGLFTLAGAPAFHLAVGHATFLPYFYLPWLLVGAIRAVQTSAFRYVVATALIVALMFYIGGLYLGFMTAVGLTVFFTVAAGMRRDWRPLVLLASVGVLSILFAAPKLLPLAAFIKDPRIVDIRIVSPVEVMTPRMIDIAFLDPYQFRRLRVAGQIYGWHEYGNYIGSFGALVVVAAILWVVFDRSRRSDRWLSVSLAISAVSMFSLMCGQLGVLAPYALMQRLPMLAHLRVPSRFTMMFLAFAVPLAAAVWSAAAPDRNAPREARLFLGLLLVLATISLAYRTRPYLEPAFPIPPIDLAFGWLSRPGAPALDMTTDAFAGVSPMLRGLADNRDVVKCNEPLTLPGSVDPQKSVVFADAPAVVSDIRFSPNRIRMGVVAPQPTRLFLNQRYLNGWISSLGPLTIDSSSGLAYVVVPGNTASRVELSFTPPGLVAGFVLLAAGVLLSAALWRRTLVRDSANSSLPAVEQKFV